MASGVPASDKRGSSFFLTKYSHTGKGGCSRDGRRTARVARRRRLRRGIASNASHRRADRGSGRRGEDATLSPSRMPSPTACRVPSLMTASS